MKNCIFCNDISNLMLHLLFPSLNRSQNFLRPVELTQISDPNIFKYVQIFKVGHKIFEDRSRYHNTL